MHATILGAGLLAPWLLCQAAPPATPACPPANAAVHELFIGADCESCWASSANDSTAPATGWRFDWIVPAGDQAPMAGAALRDSVERLARVAQPLPGPGSQQRVTRAKVATAAKSQPMALTVVSGLPLSGYYGLELVLRHHPGQHLPAGSQGWLALVELLPAGSEGSAQPRALVRSVAGPLALTALRPGKPLRHLAAMRWPDGVQVERLQARGWIEGPDGAMLAVAADRCWPLN